MEQASLLKNNAVLEEKCRIGDRRFDELNVAYRSLEEQYLQFKSSAEEQYYREIKVRDESIDHMQRRIVDLVHRNESRSSTSEKSDSLNNLSVWDVMPREAQTLFESLRKRYKEVIEVVNMMKAAPFTANTGNDFHRLKPLVDKATSCESLLDKVDSVLHNLSCVSSGTDMLQTGTPLENSLLDGKREETTDVCLKCLVDCLATAVEKGRQQVVLDIQQLLKVLLVEVLRSNGDYSVADKLVKEFFVKVGNLLKEDCEKLERMEEMVHEKDTIIRETGQQKEETLRLLEQKNYECSALRTDLKQSEDNNEILSERNEALENTLKEAKKMLQEKAKYGSMAAEFLNEYDDEIGKLESLRVEQNEKIAEQAGKIEELERLGDQKDAEIDRLKSVVKNYIKKCSTLEEDSKKKEKKASHLKKKYEELKVLFLQVEEAANSIFSKNEGLVDTNTKRQQKIDFLCKFLCRHGVNVERLVTPEIDATDQSSKPKDDLVQQHAEVVMKSGEENLAVSESEMRRLAAVLQKFTFAQQALHVSNTTFPHSEELFFSDLVLRFLLGKALPVKQSGCRMCGRFAGSSGAAWRSKDVDYVNEKEQKCRVDKIELPALDASMTI
ncbi:unnamed protein product [Enterobius vermicularis]|uniref:Dynactin domain-containing protein n=1 Tax=Enterobius vermicularis TaxID=51028 RepID=A0A0N4UZ91_ENTVE|nr:unnamed protein product [Enterobius vermicularis]